MCTNHEHALRILQVCGLRCAGQGRGAYLWCRIAGSPLPFRKSHATALNCRGTLLRCEHRTVVVGVLNVTPDSFSDGGRFMCRSDALRRADQMLEEGAEVIDVGGASSRPSGSVYGEGAEPVAEAEEIARAVPVVEAIATQFPEAVVSIDTWRPAVARAALEGGARMLNDISGLRQSAEMAEIAARAGVPLVVMHAVGIPGSLVHVRQVPDVVGRVHASLARSVALARAAGVADVIVDPGFGFGKTPRDNLRLLSGISRLQDLRCPVLIGISRKSTIGAVLGSETEPVPVRERLYGTLGATAVALVSGAGLVRTHDVRPTVEMIRVIEAIRAADRVAEVHA